MLNCFYLTFLAIQPKLDAPEELSVSSGQTKPIKWKLRFSGLIWSGKRNWKENEQRAEVKVVWLKIVLATTTTKLCSVKVLATKVWVSMTWTDSLKSNAMEGCHAWHCVCVFSGLHWCRMELNTCISKFKPVPKYHCTLFICWGLSFLLLRWIKPNNAHGSSDKQQ